MTIKIIQKRLLWIGLVYLWSCTACTKSKPYLGGDPAPIWATETDDEPLKNGLGFYTNIFPVYDNYVVANGYLNQKKRFIGIDIHSGKLLWSFFPNEAYRYGDYNNHKISEDGKLLIAAPYGLFYIDIKTGEKVWDMGLPSLSAEKITGFFNNKYFTFLARTDNLDLKTLYAGSLVDGSGSYYPALPDSADWYIYDIHLWEQGAESFLLLAYYNDIREDSIGYSIYKNHIALYNLNQDKWVYTDAQYTQGPSASTRTGEIYDEVYYSISTNAVYALDIATGRTIWVSGRQTSARDEDGHWYPTYDGGTFESLLEYENKIIVSRSSGNMWVFRKHSGDFLEELEADGGSSTLQALNGILYWVDRGSLRLRAADLSTGERLWDIKCPEERQKGGKYAFGTQVSVIPSKDGKKGRIIAMNYHNVYCYEAIR